MSITVLTRLYMVSGFGHVGVVCVVGTVGCIVIWLAFCSIDLSLACSIV